MKNLGERSVWAPDLVKRGCTRQKNELKYKKDISHYMYNVTKNAQKSPKLPMHTAANSPHNSLFLSAFLFAHSFEFFTPCVFLVYEQHLCINIHYFCINIHSVWMLTI